MSEEMQAILALTERVERVWTEMRNLRAVVLAQKVAEKSARQVRTERRDNLIRELARCVGVGAPMATATKVLLIITGNYPSPTGCERAVQLLRQNGECPTSQRQIYRIIKSRVEDD
jgi:hypothetical protein